MSSSIPFVPVLMLGTLVFTFVNFLKFVSARDWNAVVTQAIAWIAGVVAVVLVAHTDFGNTITIADHELGSLNWASQLFIGLMATSLLSTVNEIKKAIDNGDNAATPSLLPRHTKARTGMAHVNDPTQLAAKKRSR